MLSIVGLGRLVAGCDKRAQYALSRFQILVRRSLMAAATFPCFDVLWLLMPAVVTLPNPGAQWLLMPAATSPHHGVMQSLSSRNCW